MEGEEWRRLAGLAVLYLVNIAVISLLQAVLL